MITLTRSHVKRIRAVFSRGLGSAARNPRTTVQFTLAAGELRLAVCSPDFALTYTMPYDLPPQSFAIPLDALRQCEGTKNEPLQFEPQESAVLVRWTDGGIPQQARFETVEDLELPPRPENMVSNPPALRGALEAASETAADSTARYTLTCLRLRGDGQIAATDGRQLLIQRGFTFPWEGEVLVPASRVYGCKDVRCGEPLNIGRTDEWVTITSGPWTIQLKIEKEGRFPNVDDMIPAPHSAQATIQLGDADRPFLTDAVKRLPSLDPINDPITVDLNGEVIVRARGVDGAPPTELVLRNSQLVGEPMRLSSNRQYLARAAQLSFQQIGFRSPEVPACCQDERRTYLWALLEKSGIVPPEEDSIRIESTATAGERQVAAPKPVKQVAAPKDEPVTEKTQEATEDPLQGLPITLNVGLSRKVGLPNYGSVGASCHVQVELPPSGGETVEDFRQRVRWAFAACRSAVDEELSQQRTDVFTPTNNGSPRRSASPGQVRAIRTIAAQNSVNLAAELRTRFGVEDPEALSLQDASDFIDWLKAAEPEPALR